MRAWIAVSEKTAHGFHGLQSVSKGFTVEECDSADKLTAINK